MRVAVPIFRFASVGRGTIRIGRPVEFTVSWENRGTVDAEPHLVTLTGSDVTMLELIDTGEDVSDGYQFVAMFPDSPTGAFPPGESGTFRFRVTSTGFGDYNLAADAIPVSDPILVQQAFDWESVRTAARPDRLTETGMEYPVQPSHWSVWRHVVDISHGNHAGPAD